MTTVALSSTVSVASEQVSCELGDEAIVLDLKNGTYYGLDPVGAAIWNLIQTPTQVSLVRDELLRTFDVDAERCERDLLQLLGDLAAAELVIVGDGD